MGEIVGAWVKLRPNTNLTKEEIIKFCQDKIFHFKIPTYVKFVDTFPINANQKVLKNQMRETSIKELKSKKDQ